VRTTVRIACLIGSLAAVTVLSLGGCVYYNTFYHAKSAYSEAETIRTRRPPNTDPTPQELELLDRVIEKSGRVLRLHPESSWADDAHLLLATALYRQGKYESAETRLSEFATLYPGSDLAPEAGYLLAAVMLARDNPVSAEQTLTELAYADPPVDLSDDALTMIGRARHSRRRYDEAAEAYTMALERFPGSDLRAEIRFLAAENYVEMGRLEDAAHHFAAVSGEKGARQLAFEARIRLAEVYLDIGRADESLDVLGDLERRTTDRDDLDRVLLLRGRAQEALGEYDEAISTYEGIAASHARSKAAAEARYRVGLIHRDEYGVFEDAVEALREAKDEAPRTEVARDAGDAIRDIEELERSLAVIERWLKGPEEPADTLAVVVDSLATEIVPAITGVDVADTLGADQSAFVTTLDDSLLPGAVDTLALGVPDAPADTLAAAEPDTIATPEEARAMFRVGEIYLFKMGNAEDAVDYYGMVVEHFGETPLGPKAALAVAWARDRVLGQPMLSEEAYRAVLERYPGTDYALEAERALGIEPSVAVPDSLAPDGTTPDDGALEGGAPGDALEAADTGDWSDLSDGPSDEPAQAGSGEETP